MEILLMLWLAIVGLSFGSFVNAYVYRVYIAEFAPKKQRKKLSILRGRSICPNCEHVLTVKDLIPLFSWLSLRGKCRYCNEPIPSQYPIVEVIGALIFVLSYILWPLPFTGIGITLFIIWLSVAVLFMALTICDIKWMLLPNKILLPLSLSVGFWVVMYSYIEGSQVLYLSLFSALLFGGLFHILYVVSSGKWIGGGDVRLGYILGGLVLYPFNVLVVLFMSSVLALAYFLSVSLVSKSRATSVIPFGPFLIVAAAYAALSIEGLSTLMDSYFYIR